MIGKRLRELRKNKDISQEELSRIVGVTTSSITFYENDGRNPSYEVLVKIANYFCVTTDYLLGLTEDKNNIVNVPSGYALVLSQAMEGEISPEKLKKLIEFAKSFDGK
jgi:transcriptional regulator with XRE-family HTH domain